MNKKEDCFFEDSCGHSQSEDYNSYGENHLGRRDISFNDFWITNSQEQQLHDQEKDANIRLPEQDCHKDFDKNLRDWLDCNPEVKDFTSEMNEAFENNPFEDRNDQSVAADCGSEKTPIANEESKELPGVLRSQLESSEKVISNSQEIKEEEISEDINVVDFVKEYIAAFNFKAEKQKTLLLEWKSRGIDESPTDCSDYFLMNIINDWILEFKKNRIRKGSKTSPDYDFEGKLGSLYLRLTSILLKKICKKHYLESNEINKHLSQYLFWFCCVVKVLKIKRKQRSYMYQLFLDMLHFVRHRGTRKIEHIFKLYKKYTTPEISKSVICKEPPAPLTATTNGLAVRSAAILYNQNEFFNLIFGIPFDDRFDKLKGKRFTSYHNKILKKAKKLRGRD
jgi:hypothetical protein